MNNVIVEHHMYLYIRITIRTILKTELIAPGSYFFSGLYRSLQGYFSDIQNKQVIDNYKPPLQVEIYIDAADGYMNSLCPAVD